MAAEIPKILVIQGRTDPATVVREQGLMIDLARRADIRPLFINPLSDAPWPGKEVLRRGVRGAVLLGSSDIDLTVDTRNRDRYMRRTEPIARQLLDDEIPTLGLCLGHQFLNIVAGGEVGRLEERMEKGTVSLHLTPEGEALTGLPNPTRVLSGHKDVVVDLATTGVVRIGSTDRDPNSLVKIGSSAVTSQGHLEVIEAEEMENRLVSDQALAEYIQTHAYEKPDATDVFVASFMQNALRGSPLAAAA